MSDRLALQRCWNHASREAVARCPQCSRFFCRECVVEHDDRIICSGCLARAQAAAHPPKRAPFLAPLLRIAAALAGIIVAWMLFFSTGRALLSVPDEFHAESMWKRSLGDHFSDTLEP